MNNYQSLPRLFFFVLTLALFLRRDGPLFGLQGVVVGAAPVPKDSGGGGGTPGSAGATEGRFGDRPLAPPLITVAVGQQQLAFARLDLAEWASWDDDDDDDRSGGSAEGGGRGSSGGSGSSGRAGGASESKQGRSAFASAAGGVNQGAQGPPPSGAKALRTSLRRAMKGKSP